MGSSKSTTSLKIPPYGKEYLFQSDCKYALADQCSKSRALNKVIDLILYIEYF